MAIDGVDQARATSALALVTGDRGARDLLVAAYSGRGDPLEILRRAADDAVAVELEDLNELRRSAFGRTSAPAERDTAADALARLRAEEANRATDAAALLSAILTLEEWAVSRLRATEAVAAPFLADQSVRPGTPRETRRWAVRPLALVSLVLASIAVGALAVTLVSMPVLADGSFDTSVTVSTPPTSAVTNVVPGSDAIDGGSVKAAGPGSYADAKQWFQKPPTTRDAFPGSGLIEGLTASTTRLVEGTPKNLRVWVGETGDGRLCLIMSVPTADDTTEAVNGCANEQQFDAMGLGLHLGGYQAVWTGPTISMFSDLVPSRD